MFTHGATTPLNLPRPELKVFWPSGNATWEPRYPFRGAIQTSYSGTGIPSLAVGIDSSTTLLKLRTSRRLIASSPSWITAPTRRPRRRASIVEKTVPILATKYNTVRHLVYGLAGHLGFNSLMLMPYKRHVCIASVTGTFFLFEMVCIDKANMLLPSIWNCSGKVQLFI